MKVFYNYYLDFITKNYHHCAVFRLTWSKKNMEIEWDGVNWIYLAQDWN